jgi:uncharacterized cupin superfamily protein
VAERIVVASPGDVELHEEPLEPGSIVAGSPRVHEGEIAEAATAHGTLSTGVWRCGEGVVTDVEVDETFVVLSGRATIEHEGRSHEVGPGDVCVLPAGAGTRWTIHEELTKIFVTLSP